MGSDVRRDEVKQGEFRKVSLEVQSGVGSLVTMTAFSNDLNEDGSVIPHFIFHTTHISTVMIFSRRFPSEITRI